MTRRLPSPTAHLFMRLSPSPRCSVVALSDPLTTHLFLQGVDDPAEHYEAVLLEPHVGQPPSLTHLEHLVVGVVPEAAGQTRDVESPGLKGGREGNGAHSHGEENERDVEITHA